MRNIDLMVIGAQKAGTTSLKNYLNEHPEILGHPQLEFAFFKDDKIYANGYEQEFLKHFTEGDIKNAKIVVAKSAAIYASEKALKRLYDHNPECKLVFVVREPVARAHSSYLMEKFNGWLKRDFSELKTIIDTQNFNDVMYRLFIRLGLYSEHLKVIYKYFPNGQVKIILFEEFKTDPLSICKEIFEWMKIDTSFAPSIEQVHNVTKKSRSRLFTKILISLRKNNNPFKRVAKLILPYKVFTGIGNFLIKMNKSTKKPASISSEMKEYLYQYFKPYNEELQKITQISLDVWDHFFHNSKNK